MCTHLFENYGVRFNEEPLDAVNCAKSDDSGWDDEGFGH